MKCVHCGAELRDGCLYCANCGKEAQIVPDYNVLEDDDELSAMIGKKQEKSYVEPKTYKQASNDENHRRKIREQKRRQVKLIVMFFGICLCVLALIVGIMLYVSYENSNSYDYQIEQGKAYVESKDYKSAIKYYKNAIALDDDKEEGHDLLGDAYMLSFDYDNAKTEFLKVIDINPNNVDACKNLIIIYEKSKDVDAIVKLSKLPSAEEALEVFSNYIVTSPDVSMDEGTYDEYITVDLTCDKGDEILYTVDGTDPIKYGVIYDEPVSFDTEGEYTLRAVAVNDLDIYSTETKVKYTINVPTPKKATVTPNGGTFTEETKITIEIPEGCKVFYTWDGTNPNEESDEYLEPIPVKEGNNVLSVIIINDKTKKTSDVYRGNFVYYSGLSE